MLLTACDEHYLLAEGEGLIRSCAQSAPDQRFYLFLVNGDKVTDSRLRGWHPKLIVERVNWPYDPLNWHGLMCCARADPLARVLAAYGEPTIYLDADMLVRGSLQPLLAELDQCDLMVLHRPDRVQTGAAGTPYGSSFNNAVIAVRPTEAGLKFAQAYAARLRNYIASGQPIEAYRPEYGLHFYVDQELLYVTYLEHHSQINFRPLPDKFHNTRLKARAAIWHGKGDIKHNPIYVKEKLRFTRRLWYYPYSVYYQFYHVAQWFKAYLRPAGGTQNHYHTPVHK